MSVSDRESGVHADHIPQIEKAAKENNTFIFIRPTEYDSTFLIGNGYATKSTDVKHKSSNWGPMAGFVPCDPAFSKKIEGVPNARLESEPHGEAKPMQLFLKNKVVTNALSTKKIEELKQPVKVGKESITLTLVSTANKGKSMYGLVKNKPTATTPGVTYKLVRASDFSAIKPPVVVPDWAKDLWFCLTLNKENWLVWWIKFDPKNDAPQALVPLEVWGYDGVPVTGDYDLWMVAPHMADWKDHATVQVMSDVHGSSAASKYTTELIKKLNVACKRADNPVFNHGAEAQNYAFTQAIDSKVSMFTPSGRSRMVTRDKLPQVLSDVTSAGYLVIWNKRYGQVDPHLMGKPETYENLRRHYLAWFALDVYLEKFHKLRSSTEATGKDKFRAAVNAVIKDNAFKKAVGEDRHAIASFHRQLTALLRGADKGLEELEVADLPPDYAKDIKAMALLYASLPKLQEKATESAKGWGESDDSFLEWALAHEQQLKVLAK